MQLYSSSSYLAGCHLQFRRGNNSQIYSHTEGQHQKKFRVQDLVHRHFDAHNAEARDWMPDRLITGQSHWSITLSSQEVFHSIIYDLRESCTSKDMELQKTTHYTTSKELADSRPNEKLNPGLLLPRTALTVSWPPIVSSVVLTPFPSFHKWDSTENQKNIHLTYCNFKALKHTSGSKRSTSD